jgi:hypothetical protein
MSGKRAAIAAIQMHVQCLLWAALVGVLAKRNGDAESPLTAAQSQTLVVRFTAQGHQTEPCLVAEKAIN